MTKVKAAKMAKGIAVFVFGALATTWIGVLLTFGCMKLYDAFWNPSNLEVYFGEMKPSGYASLVLMAVAVCMVFMTDKIIKEGNQKEIEES